MGGRGSREGLPPGVCVQTGREPSDNQELFAESWSCFPEDPERQEPGRSWFPSCSQLRPTFCRGAFGVMFGSAKAQSRWGPTMMELKRNSEVSQLNSLTDREDNGDPCNSHILDEQGLADLLRQERET